MGYFDDKPLHGESVIVDVDENEDLLDEGYCASCGAGPDEECEVDCDCDECEEIEALDELEDLLAIALLQNLWQDNDVIEEKLVRLGVDANGMHGDLQVILSCLRRMTAIIELLIACEESDEPKARGAGG